MNRPQLKIRDLAQHSRCAWVVLVLGLGAALPACTTAQKGAAIGAAGGGLAGGVIGHQSGHKVEGAAIGAGLGGITGALVGEQMDNKFCPECGRGYTSGREYCPQDGARLRWKE